MIPLKGFSWRLNSSGNQMEPCGIASSPLMTTGLQGQPLSPVYKEWFKPIQFIPYIRHVPSVPYIRHDLNHCTSLNWYFCLQTPEQDGIVQQLAPYLDSVNPATWLHSMITLLDYYKVLYMGLPSKSTWKF